MILIGILDASHQMRIYSIRMSLEGLSNTALIAFYRVNLFLASFHNEYSYRSWFYWLSFEFR